MTYESALAAAKEFFDAYMILSANNDRVRQEVAKSNPFALSPAAKRRLRSGELKRTMVPDIVCLAFSLELSLKSLLIKLNGGAPREHNLQALFRLLAHDTQSALISKTGTECGSALTEAEFMANLENIGNAFVEWRYLHEKGPASFMPAFGVGLAKAIASELENGTAT
ncbi:MAG: HEPN domain-containing protein [Gammaproteobacteria bacterium]|nr:HEPN domain-containing protein [Gammaproteobacteria bacterium]